MGTHGVLDLSLLRLHGFTSSFPFPRTESTKPAFAGVAWELPLSKYQLEYCSLAAL